MLHLQTTGLTHISKKSKNKQGVTLTEIIVATALFALLAIPAYMLFSYGAADELSYHKTAAANRILESCRDEIKNLSYEYAASLGSSFSNINVPPSTFDTFLEFQQKFKDENFKLIGTSVKSTQGAEHIKFDLKVTWTRRNGSLAEEKLSFIKVK